MIAVVIEAGPVLDRRRDPDGGEPQVADVVEALDQAFEVSTPVRILRLTGGVELDAAATEEVAGGSW